MEIKDIQSRKLGITTEDGYTPLYSPDAGLRWHHYNDIYFGKEGLNKVVPNVNDLVMSPTANNIKVWLVVAINPVTFVAELKRVGIETVLNVDEITSTSDQNFRIFFDDTQDPFVLSPETFLKSYSPEATVYRIYRGPLIEESKIISKLFNNSGVFNGFDIPMFRAGFDSHDNNCIMSFPSCNTDVELMDGEVVTLAVYSNRGQLIGDHKCLIDKTTFVNQSYKISRYITEISIKSAFVDPNDETKINYPIDLPMKSFQPIGVVSYNDGTTREFVINDGKFSLYGLGTTDTTTGNESLVNNFAANTIGHKIPLTLVYHLDDDEINNVPQGYNQRAIARNYWMIVSEPNRTYNVKLYIYPEWIDEYSGYQLRFYLLNLDRNIFYRLTNDIMELATTSQPFYPNLMGVTQRITYGIELSKVSNAYLRDVKHIQTFEVILRAPANANDNKNIWEVATEVPTNLPFFGTDLQASNLDAKLNKLTIDNNFKDVDDMLQQLYLNTGPLYIPSIEVEPPRPTHIGVMVNNERVMIRVEDYKDVIEFKDPFKLYSNITLIFYQETVGDYLTVGVSNLTIRK